MDGLIPAEVVLKHYIYHKFTIEFGPSITDLFSGRAVRNVILGGILIYTVGDLVRGALQAVLNRKSTSSKGKDNKGKDNKDLD